MCDTMVSLTPDGVLFAKNSDRDPNEAQYLDWIPASDYAAGSALRCTWIDVPQVEHTHAVLLSRPWWMWGAEIGANEHGVVIGNEAVFTRGPAGDRALLGMDLVRLGLERARTAAEAIEVMVTLLERHGQGGPCSYEHPGFTYDNSYMVADPSGAIVLETAGTAWATEEVTGPARSISNGLTIPSFAAAHRDRLKERVSACAIRQPLTQRAAEVASTPRELFSVLRSHGGSIAPSYSVLNGGMAAPCMHAGGLVANSQTTASWVADLRADPVHWVTGTAAPCTSLFKPVQVGDPVDLGPRPDNVADPRTLWWRHELLHRRSMRDPLGSYARFAHERDRLEQRWLNAPPASGDAFAIADRLERSWYDDLAAGALPDHRGTRLKRYWTAQDRAAAFDEAAFDAAAFAPAADLPA